jgi:hypothetical protein
MDNHRNCISFLDMDRFIMLARNPKETLKPFLYVGELNPTEMDMSLPYKEYLDLQVEMFRMQKHVKLVVTR